MFSPLQEDAGAFQKKGLNGFGGDLLVIPEFAATKAASGLKSDCSFVAFYVSGKINYGR